jgi:hypothetical protein
MSPSPSLGPPLLSPSWSPPLSCGIPLLLAGGVVTVCVVGGGGGGVVAVWVMGGGGGVVTTCVVVAGGGGGGVVAVCVVACFTNRGLGLGFGLGLVAGLAAVVAVVLVVLVVTGGGVLCVEVDFDDPHALTASAIVTAASEGRRCFISTDKDSARARLLPRI